MTSPLKPLSQFCSNFIWSLFRVGERKIAKMVAVIWPRWPPRPYMVKTFKNLLLQNRECLGAEPLQESSGTGGLSKLWKELSYIDVWPFYGKVKFASLCIWMGKTFKNLLLQNQACLMAEFLHISSGTGGLPKLLKLWCTLTFDLFTVRSILLPYAFEWEKCSEFQTTSPLANFAQISYGATLGRGNKRFLKWSWFVDQDGRHAHIW